jgi:hypothetical protein
MTKLSPKALRFIDAAVAESKDPRLRAAWSGFDRDRIKELPDPVARAALSALQKVERRLRRELESPSLSEDDAAEVSNDLGFVCAVESDLKRQLEPGRV